MKASEKNMKKKVLLGLMCGVMVLGFATGCGNDKKENQDTSKDNQSNVSETKNTILTCTYEAKAENEYEASTKEMEEYTYTKDMILINMKTVREEEYSTEDIYNRRKEQEENYVTRANGYEGVSATIEEKENNTYIITYNYEIDKIDKDSVLGTGAKKYIDSNNKFSVDDYKASFLDTHKNSNATCTEK